MICGFMTCLEQISPLSHCFIWMPFRGTRGFCGDMDVVLDHAARDLTALQDGGVDGILIANEFSLPYQPVADIAVISAMAYIIGKLKDRIRVPFGVNCCKNPIATH